MENIKIKKIIVKNYIVQRLDKTISNLLPEYSRCCIKKWILNSFVSVNNKIINKPKKKISGGEQIVIKCFIENEKKYLYPQNIKLNIIYEDKDILIINKPNNIIVHPGHGNFNNTILNALIYHYPLNISLPRGGIIHRLDKNTTGLMIVAKNNNSYYFLKNSLKKHKIKREYEAIISGILSENGCIDQPIKRHHYKRIKMAIHASGRKSITHYKILENFRYHTHVRLKLETGRTHQIRVHMSYINHNIVGDQLYGNGKSFLYKNFFNKKLLNVLKKFKRQALHAISLELYHPKTGEKMKFIASIPDDMKELIKELKNDYYHSHY